MKKLLVALVICTVLVWPASASAHVLKTDGSIGAIMHMNPDDDPVAGQATAFYFDIKDKTSTFTLADCSCSFAVSKSGNQLYSQPASGTGSSAGATYTFPARGAYTIQLSGKPTGNGNFQDFSLTYNVRVDRSALAGDTATAPAAEAGGNLLITSIAGLLVASFITLFVLSIKKAKRPKT